MASGIGSFLTTKQTRNRKTKKKAFLFHNTKRFTFNNSLRECVKSLSLKSTPMGTPLARVCVCAKHEIQCSVHSQATLIGTPHSCKEDGIRQQEPTSGVQPIKLVFKDTDSLGCSYHLPELSCSASDSYPCLKKDYMVSLGHVVFVS